MFGVEKPLQKGKPGQLTAAAAAAAAASSKLLGASDKQFPEPPPTPLNQRFKHQAVNSKHFPLLGCAALCAPLSQAH